MKCATMVLISWWLLGGFCPSSSCEAAPAGRLERREFQINGVMRQALVYVPEAARSRATPVVFVFHGHGGNAANAARSFAMHRHWPEAISVYMQGLNTPGRLTDPEGKKTGWQPRPGDQGGRDLLFFDTVLATLKKDYKVDSRRIYSTGHSNGGAFTYLLWEMRGDVLAAIAPSAAPGPFWAKATLNPKPVLHLAGEKDPLVKYEWQQRTMNVVRKINQCASEGHTWKARIGGPGRCTVFESKLGAPFVSFIHPGGHGFPAAGPQLIASFFQRIPKPVTTQ